jgi:hypothetical protein
VGTRGGKVTFKSNSDEASSDESIFKKLTAMKRLAMILFF